MRGDCSKSDSSQQYTCGLRLRLSVPPTCLHQTEGNCEASRLPLREFPYMPGSRTSWRSNAPRAVTAFAVAFRPCSIPLRGCNTAARDSAFLLLHQSQPYGVSTIRPGSWYRVLLFVQLIHDMVQILCHLR
jgi:hypothetical protein